ncbi:MAG: SDR family oxidoreductase [Deltaproteobacteria bacterium]|nr:SDR family oxidoreductase [Deltaproteobacteria bacterium]
MRNDSVKHLWLKRNPIGDRGIGSLCEWLAKSKRARSLDLVQTGATAVGLRALSSAMAEGGTVERLYLGGNRLEPKDADALGELIRANPQLRELYAETNAWGRYGVGAILEAVIDASQLGVLELPSSGIVAESGASLSEMLASHGALERLSLGQSPSARFLGAPRNRLQDAGAVEMAVGLAVNDRLSLLNLGGNEIFAAGAYALLHAAERQTSLAEVRRSTLQPGATSRETVSPSLSAMAAISKADLEVCARVLSAFAASPETFWSDPDSHVKAVRAESNRLISALKEESRRRRQPARRHRVPDPVKRERFALSSHVPSKQCYVCRKRAAIVEAFLCASCHALSEMKRTFSAPLAGAAVFITGGRIKVGFESVLKLLRANARVALTTRFPANALERFRLQPDYEAFRQRLHIVGFDLRNVLGIPSLIKAVGECLGQIDVVINNAAITIHRPPEYYRELLEQERLPGADPNQLGLPGLVRAWDAWPYELAAFVERTLAPFDPNAKPEALFPRGQTDDEGLPLDLRKLNSWRCELPDISTGELLETHLVNAVAPFIVIREALPLLRKSSSSVRQIINVSAMEGSFSKAYKTHRHPHTNMAKASLNMLTRTLGEWLAAEGILVNSVDTGWITDENPHAIRTRRGKTLKRMPLDAIDGAARVCDPIFSAALGNYPGFGQFLKDYRPTAW